MFEQYPEDPTWRLHSLHRAMTVEEFERTVPVRAGWKREYYGGMAHVRPSWAMAVFEYDLADLPHMGSGRPVTPDDRPALADAFADAFRVAPDYCDYPDEKYPAEVEGYFSRFYGEARGERSHSSRLIEEGGRVVAAALVKRNDRGPLLDCLLVRPSCARHGLATAVTRAAFAALAADGEKSVRSYAKLANEMSIAWHLAFGFRELPNLWVTESRLFCTARELERLKVLGSLTPDDEQRLRSVIDREEVEYRRLQAMKKGNIAAVFPEVD